MPKKYTITYMYNIKIVIKGKLKKMFRMILKIELLCFDVFICVDNLNFIIHK